jgi:hypothetical protein
MRGARLMAYKRPYTPEVLKKLREAQKRWYHQNLEKCRRRRRELRKIRPAEQRERESSKRKIWRERNKDKNRERNKFHYLTKHIPNQEIEAGRPKPTHCDICGEDKLRIHFDHCHQRGIFRGWLCQHCNVILGLVKEDPDRLRKLIAYLERTKFLVSPQLTLPGI